MRYKVELIKYNTKSKTESILDAIIPTGGHDYTDGIDTETLVFDTYSELEYEVAADKKKYKANIIPQDDGTYNIVAWFVYILDYHGNKFVLNIGYINEKGNICDLKPKTETLEATAKRLKIYSMNIRALREKTSLSRAELARRLSIPYKTIEKWESDSRPPAPYLVKLIDYYLEHEGLYNTEE